jgi:hypothetical protein
VHDEDTRPVKRPRIEEVPTHVISKFPTIPTQRTPPRKFKPLPLSTPSPVKSPKPAQPSRDILSAIIAQANEAARQLQLQQEAEVKADAEEEEAKKRERREKRKQRSEEKRKQRNEEKRVRKRREKERAKGKERPKVSADKEKHTERKHKSSSPSNGEREAKKEKQLLKLVGAVVVGYLSQYRQYMDNEQFKKHAKEVYLFYLSNPYTDHVGLKAHAYHHGTREKRRDLPFRRQTRGVVRREAHKDQEVRQELRGKALEKTARLFKRDEGRELYFPRPQSSGRRTYWFPGEWNFG